MSKIHEALKRAAGAADEATSDVPSHTPDPAAEITPSSGPGAAGIHQDEVDPPPLRFDMIRARSGEAHNFLVAEQAPKSMAAEQFRTLRTRIQRISTGSLRKLLLVTSPGPGEGKTLVSVNLAMSLAQEVDSRVLLVGCDLRRPSLHRLLGLPDDQQPGLTQYLAGRVSLERAIWRYDGTSLHILPAGSVPDNPSELLGSRRMERTLHYLAGQFDQVVLDAPPLNPVADPAILVPLVDGVLLVVRYGQTGRASLSKALEAIPDDKVLGMVFNAADMRFSGYYYSYEYQTRLRSNDARFYDKTAAINPQGKGKMSRFAENRVRVRQTIMVSMEAVLLFSSIFFARLANDDWSLEHALTVSYILKCLLVTSILTICFYYNGLYDLALVIKDPISSVIRFLRAFGTGAILLAIAYWLVPSLAIERDIVLTFLVVQLGLFTVLRIGFFRWAITSPIFARRILIVGIDQMAMKIAREIVQRVETGYTLQGFTNENKEMVGQVVLGIPVVCSYEQIHEYCIKNQIGIVVVALSDRRAQLPLWQLLECKMKGVLIEEVTAFYEKMTGQIMVEDIRPSSIIFSEGYRISRVQLTIKRLVDIIISLLGLIFGLPLMVLAALAIRLSSHGGVFYLQERVGQHGKPFTLIKLRTMRSDAEKETGPVWASTNDSRVSRVGKFLRLARLDELPQMWNILRGDMSFVGPRPEREFFIRDLQEEIPFYIQRLAVKPGLTGWAQVRFQYADSKEQTLIKLQYDLYYIKHLSVVLDLIIVLDTFRVVILGKGQ